MGIGMKNLWSKAATVGLVGALAASGGAYALDRTSTPDQSFQFEHVSCTGAENEIRVVINNVEQGVGLMVADLYRNDKDGFLKRDGRVAQVRFAARAPQTNFCFQAPTPELYAIAVYHDTNANKTLDRLSFGLPAEPYGISNNPKIRFGPPSVDQAIFEVASEGANVEINLKN
ncbi:MAG: DUF2141 domain-containing protein [Pseudomonadota bacterium]